MTLTQRLALLEQLRGDLADNLTAVGVAADRTQTLEVLVPKVLQVLNAAAEQFSASLKTGWSVSYGFFTTGETVSFSGLVTLNSCVRVTRLTYTVSGTGASALTVSGAGWTVSKSGSTITAVYAPGGVIPAETARQALGKITVAGDGKTAVSAKVTLKATGVSGTQYAASGTAAFSYAYGLTWKNIEAAGLTWSKLEGKTWSALEAWSKP